MQTILCNKSTRVLHDWNLANPRDSAHYCEPVTPYHSTQRVEGISGGAQKELSEYQGGQQARGMRWPQVFGYEQVVSDVGHPETKIRYVYSLVWLVDVLECCVPFCPVCAVARFWLLCVDNVVPWVFVAVGEVLQ